MPFPGRTSTRSMSDQEWTSDSGIFDVASRMFCQGISGTVLVPSVIAGWIQSICFFNCNNNPDPMTNSNGMKIITAPQRCSFRVHRFHENAMSFQTTLYLPIGNLEAKPQRVEVLRRPSKDLSKTDPPTSMVDSHLPVGYGTLWKTLRCLMCQFGRVGSVLTTTSISPIISPTVGPRRVLQFPSVVSFLNGSDGN